MEGVLRGAPVHEFLVRSSSFTASTRPQVYVDAFSLICFSFFVVRHSRGAGSLCTLTNGNYYSLALATFVFFSD